MRPLSIEQARRRGVVAGLAEPAATPVARMFWYRWTRGVLRRAVPLGLAGVTLLAVLGLPFLGVRWGYPDDRSLPTSLSARQVGDTLRADFANNSESALTVVFPDAAGVSGGDLQRYAAQLSRVPDVSGVSVPSGTFVNGVLATIATTVRG